MRCLVIDDERSALHLFLENVIDYYQNVQFLFFLDSKEKIISFIEHNKVEAVFLDVKMPQINGIELASYLVEKNKNIKIVFITGLNITYQDLPLDVKNNTLKILYKPLIKEELLSIIETIITSEVSFKVSLFGTFDCFVNSQTLKFSSSKSKELLALLITLKGKELTLDHAITLLWPDKELAKAKSLYRDAVWRLRATLKDYGIDIIDFARGVLKLKTLDFECDYYKFLEGDKKLYKKDFCSPYEWSLDIQEEIDRLYRSM